MKRLQMDLRRDGFDLEQIFRQENIAIYRQTKEGQESVAFEVVRIREQNAREFNGVKIEAGEAYPSSEQWGVNGWTFPDLEGACSKLNELRFSAIPSPVSLFENSGRITRRPRG